MFLKNVKSVEKIASISLPNKRLISNILFLERTLYNEVMNGAKFIKDAPFNRKRFEYIPLQFRYSNKHAMTDKPSSVESQKGEISNRWFKSVKTIKYEKRTFKYSLGILRVIAP